MRIPRVTEVERFVVKVPFTPRCLDWNAREVWRWQLIEICRVRTEDPDVVGYGESTYYYTSGNASDAAIARVIGENPLTLLHDDRLGLDLQMALYDAAGKAVGVPIYQLLPLPKVRDRCPLGWWNIDMSAEAFAAEAQEAASQGYRYHKIKGRPWFDIYAQIEAIGAVTPPDYRIDVDFNDFLLHVGNATPVLSELDRYDSILLYEGPIPQRDVEGYRLLRQKVKKPLAIHFGLPPFPTAMREEVCDGFVLFGGVNELIRQGMLAAAFEKEFFLQQVGTGITTAMIAHIGAVLTHARWPAITCMNNYSDDLLTDPLTISSGNVVVPVGPGLGVTIDEDALENFRVDPPYDIPERRHLMTVSWPGGRTVTYAHMKRQVPLGTPSYSHLQYGTGVRAESARHVWEDFLSGNHPVMARGVRMDVTLDDGSEEFARRYEDAEEGLLFD